MPGSLLLLSSEILYYILFLCCTSDTQCGSAFCSRLSLARPLHLITALLLDIHRETDVAAAFFLFVPRGDHVRENSKSI